MPSQTEQIEELRQQEVKDRNLYDCSQKFYAKRKPIQDIVMCAGYEVGVGGKGVAVSCSDCQFYFRNFPPVQTPKLEHKTPRNPRGFSADLDLSTRSSPPYEVLEESAQSSPSELPVLVVKVETSLGIPSSRPQEPTLAEMGRRCRAMLDQESHWLY